MESEKSGYRIHSNKVNMYGKHENIYSDVVKYYYKWKELHFLFEYILKYDLFLWW